ncbi:MAG: hypothetical protein ACI8QS_002909 [Planctomycetota bacterium]|jgi:hypothetical protein
MAPTDEQEQELPSTIIEHARSGRAKCKGCRKVIQKDELRLGVMVEGPFGQGHMWYHLECSAGHVMEKLEEAYKTESWKEAKSPPDPKDLPDLDFFRSLANKAEEKRAEKAQNKKVIPYAEIAPSDRSKCKQSGEPIPKGAVRIVLGKEAQFGNQVRISPFAVLPQYVASALNDPEIGTQAEGLFEQLLANSKIEQEQLDEAIVEIGEL